MWRRILSRCFHKPKWFFTHFSIIFIELLATKRLHYSIYILFIYPIIQCILTLFFILGTSHFIFDVCFSDYLNERWESPHYPIIFWDLFEDSAHWYQLQLKPTANFTLINTQRNLYCWKVRKKVTRQSHESQLVTKVKGRNFNLKTAAFYRMLYGVRFMHTEIIHKEVLHTATAFFCRSFMDKVALINNNWSHLPNIQKTTIPNVFPKNVYMNLPENLQYVKEPSHFINAVELNTPLHFKELIKEKVIVEPYNPLSHHK